MSIQRSHMGVHQNIQTPFQKQKRCKKRMPAQVSFGSDWSSLLGTRWTGGVHVSEPEGAVPMARTGSQFQIALLSEVFSRFPHCFFWGNPFSPPTAPRPSSFAGSLAIPLFAGESGQKDSCASSVAPYLPTRGDQSEGTQKGLAFWTEILLANYPVLCRVPCNTRQPQRTLLPWCRSRLESEKTEQLCSWHCSKQKMTTW